MNYNVNIREECFGATVMNLKTGKREYITKDELDKITRNTIFPKDSIANIDNEEYKIKFTELKNKESKENYFSFADIAYIEITRACNLKCKHCLNNSGTKMPNQLTKSELLTLISKLVFKKLDLREENH